MAGTPFVFDAGVEFAGASPRRFRPRSSCRFWLGKPGNMIQLPSPSQGFTKTATQGETSHGLLSGGTAVTRNGSEKWQWQLQWPSLAGRDWQVLHGFYRRLFGAGPWAFVTPEETNYLTAAASLCGALDGVVEGWQVSHGTLAYDPTVAAPIMPSGVMRWAGATTSSLLIGGLSVAGVPTPDLDVSPVYVPAEPVAFTIWAATSTGTASVTLTLSGRAADGTLIAHLDAEVAVTLTTTPQRLTVVCDPGELAASPYVLPVVTCGTSTAPDILLSAPQVEYAFSATDWAVGAGCPRVVMPAAVERPIDGRLQSSPSMTLAEI